ncbi:hypothetical protein TRV_02900 [Trichophyton verrucosum HKI 0517]|uniref:Uncharacterized protein n=1 Tax=Trichophyton verrucosum (strain HKI 0517) TaxID=663202 RepID=D4D721_TRIVH|nr:uncharacterized protein TRV_02900 [Trichophyton verrucosum HKI 0517]EFE42376.1 hypothetical protein TRV_02900 [Trichophyton verrucosum HKI 0517]
MDGLLYSLAVVEGRHATGRQAAKMKTTGRRLEEKEEEDEEDEKDEKKRYRLRLQAVRQQDFPATYAQLRRRWWHDQKSTSQPLLEETATTVSVTAASSSYLGFKFQVCPGGGYPAAQQGASGRKNYKAGGKEGYLKQLLAQRAKKEEAGPPKKRRRLPPTEHEMPNCSSPRRWASRGGDGIRYCFFSSLIFAALLRGRQADGSRRSSDGVCMTIKAGTDARERLEIQFGGSRRNN